jgi:3-methyladenine DNA glycosylase AlkD
MDSYLQPITALYQQAANPADAAFMKKYMKDQFEYFGIRAPQQKEIRTHFFKTYGLPDPAEVPEMVKELWIQPEREYQYFAIDLSEKVLKKMGEDAIETIEFMVMNKSWWDTVDWVASHHAGTYFKIFPEKIPEITDAWMDSGNMWLQRTALLFQLKYKKTTNEDLMFAYMSRLNESKEFFIRKAIGWALREYSKTAPESVISFVETTELSGLSRREALKVIERNKSK